MPSPIASGSRLVCFSHGKESGPWGIKITRLAEVARRHGYDVMSVDYRHSPDPYERLRQLIDQRPTADCLVLAGSSMGGWVSAQACAALRPRGLFLMAPALYFPGYDEEPEAVPAHCAVVHGWHDDIVPVEAALRFARRHAAALHLLDAGHGLTEVLPALDRLFGAFLDDCVA